MKPRVDSRYTDTEEPSLVRSATTRPRLLDLFCGADGAAVGYHLAGFDVVGVDLVRQPSYPFPFHLGDAMTFPLDGYDAIHASPPCKRFTVARKPSQSLAPVLFDPHPDLMTPTIARLSAQPTTWVVENVPGAPMGDPFVLCGSMFGLRVRRHRLFVSSVPMAAPACRHAEAGPVVGVYGAGGAWARTAPGGGGVKVAGVEAAAALGIDWTDKQTELSQAVPPAYTEWVGSQLLCSCQAQSGPSNGD